MNCERYQNEIEDFLYGELMEKRAAGIRTHLAECSACAAMRDQIERENDIFTQFYEQTQIEPTGEMWEAIRARINAGQRHSIKEQSGFSSALGWLLKPAVIRQAGFALLLIALSVVVTIYFLKRDGQDDRNTARRDTPVTATPAPPPVVTPSPVPTSGSDLAGQKQHPPAPQRPEHSGRPVNRQTNRANRQPSPPLTEQELIHQQIARAEREYRSAIHLLDSAIAKRRDSLDPAVMREYATSLAMIDDSIAKSRRALRERPDDIAAGQFLLAAYAKKVELMQDIAMR
jgi:hypothetical protein